MAADDHQKQSLQNEDELCTIEASVVTGFEESARGEAREKFNTDVKAARGRITWRVPLNKVNDVLKMGSVDNCKVVVHTVPCFPFTDQHDSLAGLQKMVKDIDWEIGLRAWQRVYNFPYPIASLPDVIPSADDLVDVVIITHQPPPKDKSSKKDKKKGRWGKKKDKKNDNRSNTGNIASCDPATNSPAEELSAKGQEDVAKEEFAGSKSALGDSIERSQRSPVNEKGDADVKKESDLLASHEEEVGPMDGNDSGVSKKDIGNDSGVSKKDNGNDSGVSKKDSGASMNSLATPHLGQPLLKLDSAGTARIQSQLQTKEGESFRKQTSESDVHLTVGLSDEATKQTPMSLSDNNVSPPQNSSADSSLSPVSKKINESEFASSVIRRLTSPQEAVPKEDVSGNDSPKMSCVTPPPTPIRSMDNPFSNLQGRLHAVLLPFLDNTKLPDRGDTLQGSQQDYIDDTGGSVDPKLSLSTSAAQIESLSPNVMSSNLTHVPSLSALATSAHGTKSGSHREISADDSENSMQQDVGAESLVEKDSGKTDGGAAVKKEHDSTKPRFRVTCFRTGESHAFDSTSAAASFGSAIVAYFGWQVDLKNFDIEVILNIDNDEVTVSLALTKMSLHYRNLVAFGPTTLRATICYNMLRLCRIKYGDIVCDPMCGSFAIPIEGALNWVNCFHFGGDIHEKAIDKTILNIAGIEGKQKQDNQGSLKLDAVQWDVQNLPLRDQCVDVFVSDLPFGHRMGSRSTNPALYLKLLSEMARTARPGARACLLTEDRNNIIKAIQNLGRYWQRRLILNINIGGLTGFVFLLTRTAASVAPSCTDWRQDGESQPTDGGQDGSEHPAADSSSVTDCFSVSNAESRTGTE